MSSASYVIGICIDNSVLLSENAEHNALRYVNTIIFKNDFPILETLCDGYNTCIVYRKGLPIRPNIELVLKLLNDEEVKYIFKRFQDKFNIVRPICLLNLSSFINTTQFYNQ